jgi:hypothetical protein
MTFGSCDGPKQAGDPGRSLFNGGNLTRVGLASVGSLSYQELVPGHHQHLYTQSENRARHPLLQHAFVNACSHGCDIPGQSLAQWLGDTSMFALRSRMEAARAASASASGSSTARCCTRARCRCRTLPSTSATSSPPSRPRPEGGPSCGSCRSGAPASSTATAPIAPSG